MASSPDETLFRIGEVSRLTATKTFVLRYWETEFPTLQPVKSPSGHRLYRREVSKLFSRLSGCSMTKVLRLRARGVSAGHTDAEHVSDALEHFERR